MQDRYVGDIGDYLKYALLRQLQGKRALGIAWYRVTDENHNADGKHTSYLTQPKRWSGVDPTVYNALRGIVEAGQRKLDAVQASSIFDNVTFANKPIPVPENWRNRQSQRIAWFNDVKATLRDCDLVFLDPDNGLRTDTFSVGKHAARKYVLLSELCEMRREGRTVIVYHHQGRTKGGNLIELSSLCDRIQSAGGYRPSGVVRALRGTTRAFLIFDGTEHDLEVCSSLASRWPGNYSWHLVNDLCGARR